MSSTFDAAELEALLSVPDGPCASIFLPTPPSGGPALRISLGHRLEEAGAFLAAAGVPAEAIEAAVAEGRRLVEEASPPRGNSASLALFLAPELQSLYLLPTTPNEETIGGQVPHVLPLVALLADLEPFLVLALGQKSVQLYRADRYSIEKLDLHGPDLDLESVLGEDRERGTRQMHSAGRGPGVVHGQGSLADEHKDALVRWCRGVDDAIRDRIAGTPPMVLAAVDYVAAIFRQVSRYPGLQEDGIDTAVDPTAVPVLRDRGWEIVGRSLEQRRGEALDRFRSLWGTGKASADLAEVLAAAEQGRIELLLCTGATCYGPYPFPGGATSRPSQEPGTEELVNRAAVETLRKGGRVEQVAPEALDGEAVGAVFRW